MTGSLVALLTTLVLLFGFQGEQILSQPLIILMLAVPILIQVYFNSTLAYGLMRLLKVQHSVAAPGALIGGGGARTAPSTTSSAVCPSATTSARASP